MREVKLPAWAYSRPTEDKVCDQLARTSRRFADSELESALASQVGGDHYRQGGIQPVQYIEANALGFLEGCVVKRLTRHNRPTGKGRQDIEKAIHELQLLLELRYGETK